LARRLLFINHRIGFDKIKKRDPFRQFRNALRPAPAWARMAAKA
jgi:hypothetical protein